MEMETISKDPAVAKYSQYLKILLGYQNYRPMKNPKFETLTFEGQK